MLAHKLETPVTIVDLDILESNITRMARLAEANGVALRPMVKTHKAPDIARRQMEAGAIGVLVATIDEAEVMAAAGIDDITIAYPLIAPRQRERLAALAARVRLTLSVDSTAAVAPYAALFARSDTPVAVLIIVDSGGRRLGVAPEAAPQVAAAIAAAPGLRLAGVSTHPGHVYGCSSPDAVRDVATEETTAVLQAAQSLRDAGMAVDTVAVGSTPTARFAAKTPGITEIRPGNYVFYDAIQVALGAATVNDCALKIVGTIISRPTTDTAVVDVGSKMLSSDRGAHGLDLVQGYGYVPASPDVIVARVSEELAVLELPAEMQLAVGDTIEIVPNHACTACNLVDNLYGIRDGVVQETIPVAARRAVPPVLGV